MLIWRLMLNTVAIFSCFYVNKTKTSFANMSTVPRKRLRLQHSHLQISLRHFPQKNSSLSHIQRMHSTGRRTGQRWTYKQTMIIQKGCERLLSSSVDNNTDGPESEFLIGRILNNMFVCKYLVLVICFNNNIWMFQQFVYSCGENMFSWLYSH